MIVQWKDCQCGYDCSIRIVTVNYDDGDLYARYECNSENYGRIISRVKEVVESMKDEDSELALNY